MSVLYIQLWRTGAGIRLSPNDLFLGRRADRGLDCYTAPAKPSAVAGGDDPENPTLDPIEPAVGQQAIAPYAFQRSAKHLRFAVSRGVATL